MNLSSAAVVLSDIIPQRMRKKTTSTLPFFFSLVLPLVSGTKAPCSDRKQEKNTLFRHEIIACQSVPLLLNYSQQNGLFQGAKTLSGDWPRYHFCLIFKLVRI